MLGTIFIRMNKKLTRDTNNKLLGGVVSGIAKYLGHDVTLWRLGTFVTFVFTGFFPIALIYIGAWIIMPDGNKEVVVTYDIYE